MSNSLYSFIKDLESHRNLSANMVDDDTLTFCALVFLFTFVFVIGIFIFASIVFVCVMVLPDALRIEYRRLRPERCVLVCRRGGGESTRETRV